MMYGEISEAIYVGGYQGLQCQRKDCRYRKTQPMIGSHCDYIGDAKRSRGCLPGECDKYVPMTKDKRRKQNDILINPVQIAKYRKRGKQG